MSLNLLQSCPAYALGFAFATSVKRTCKVTGCTTMMSVGKIQGGSEERVGKKN